MTREVSARPVALERPSRALLVPLLALGAVAGCGDDLLDPREVVSVSGSYTATTFDVDGASVLGSMDIQLQPVPGESDTGPTEGTLEVSSGPGGDRQLPLEGQWSFAFVNDVPVVTFAFEATDPLLDDLEQLDFEVSRLRLEGSGDVDGTSYLVVLEQR